MKKIFVITLYLFAFFCVTTPVTHSAKLHENINVLLFTVDSLRPDHLSCYGYEQNTTPTLDTLAKAGVTFDQTIAQSAWTSPGLISIFTSLLSTHSQSGSARAEY